MSRLLFNLIRRCYSFSNLEQAQRRIGPTDRIPFSDKKRRREEKFYLYCCAGMEDIAAEELNQPWIGASSVEKTPSGVMFRGESMRVGYAACLWHRTGHRILHYILKSKLPTNLPANESLRDFVAKIRDLDRYIATGHRVGVKSSVWGCTTVKDNLTVNRIVLQAMKEEAKRRGINIAPALDGSLYVDVPFYLSVYRNHAILFRDLTGPTLNARGYRRIFQPAALTEPTAAGLLYLSGWDQICEREGAVFVDPMCGSGTLLCEAALMATRSAPGLLRSDWTFPTWPDYDADLWNSLNQEAQAAQRPWKGQALGCDIHPIAGQLAYKAAKSIGMDPWINVTVGNCSQWNPCKSIDLVVCDPPWGLKKRREVPPYRLISALSASWNDLGKFLWRNCKGSKAYFVCNHPFLYRQLNLWLTERRPLWIGGVHLGFYGIHLDDAKLFEHHSRRQFQQIAVDPRTDEERADEIEEARKTLNVEMTTTQQSTKNEQITSIRRPQYSWKYQKFKSSV